MVRFGDKRPITTYQQRMAVCVNALLGEGDRAFTQSMLAERMAVKITPSFRNRLRELEARGVIESWRFQAENNSYPIAYSRPGEWSNGEPVWKNHHD